MGGVSAHTVENERDFSRLGALLSPFRAGRMKDETIDRKMLLMMNEGKYWWPNPDLKDNPAMKELLQDAGVESVAALEESDSD